MDEETYRAGMGAGMIATAIYAALVGHNHFGLDYAGLFAAVSPYPLHTVPRLIWIPFAAWLVFAATGVLNFIVGARRSWCRRDAITTAKALASAACPAALMWWGGYVPDWTIVNLCLTGIYVWWLVSALTRLLLSLKGIMPVRLPEAGAASGMPLSGPATQAQAQENLSGETAWRPPKFRS